MQACRGACTCQQLYDVAGCDSIEREQLLIGYYTCMSLPNQQNIRAEAALSALICFLSLCEKWKSRLYLDKHKKANPIMLRAIVAGPKSVTDMFT